MIKRWKLRDIWTLQIITTWVQEEQPTEDYVRAFGDPNDFTILEEDIPLSERKGIARSKIDEAINSSISLSSFLDAYQEQVHNGNSDPMNNILSTISDIKANNPVPNE